jgi:HAD superfamily hydrolase (TIGR01549 family)
VDRIAESPIILPAAVLFDMDGTLTEPMLDFPKIKTEMGIGDRPILEALDELSGRRRIEAEAILLRHEEHAAQNSTLNAGCRELLDWLKTNQISVALITRNSRASVEAVLARHGLSLDVLITREDPPFKPNPHPLQLACKKLDVPESNVWMVGDGKYDVEAGLAANIKTVWLSHGQPRPFEAHPWLAVQDLFELHRLLVQAGEALGHDRP